MAGGFYSGLLWGGVVSVGVAGVASLVGDLPPDLHSGRGAQTAAIEEPVKGLSDDAQPTATPIVPSDAQVRLTGEDDPAHVVLDVAAKEANETGPEKVALQADLQPPKSPEIRPNQITDEQPIHDVHQEVQSSVLQPVDEATRRSTPQTAGNLSPVAPTVAQSGVMATPATDAEGAAALQDLMPTPSVSPDLPMDEAVTAARATAPDLPDLPTLQAVPNPAVSPTGPVTQTVTQTVTPPVASVADGPKILDEQVSEAADPKGADPEGVVPENRIVASLSETAPRKPFQNLAPNVATNRLPSLGKPATGTGSADSTDDAAHPTQTDPTAAKEDLPAIQRYAAAFENPTNKPLMAIVLVDDGTGSVGVDTLTSFPYPISIAVDSQWDGAANAMTTYRKAGFEVLALVDLAPDSSAADAETNIAVTLDTLSSVVAVMEGTETGIQGNRVLSDQVTAIVKDSGHGLLLFPKGLNTAQKLAVKTGVPAASVFRDFDGKGQNAKAIRRFLDHAAFKAGQQENGVVMVGRLKADTIGALILWGLQDRASSLALAPVSAVLAPQPQ